MRQQIKDGVQYKIEETQNQKRQKAEQVKYEKQEVSEQVNLIRQQEQLKNASMKQMIKNQEMGLQDRKYREAMERKARAR